MNFAAQHEGAQHRHQRQREQQRAAEREHHGERHRMKHFPFDARQRENRDIDDRDDDHAEEHRIADLFARGEHGLSAFLDRERAAKLVLPLSKLADDVLHDDDRAIDDQAEVHRAETHQVSGDAEARHAREREQKRKRDRRGDDERRAPVAQQRKQHGDHQHRAFEKIGFDRVDGAVDKLRAVVLDLNFHAVGQLGLNLGDARLDPLGDFAAVLAGEHHRRADDRLVAVERGRAGAEFGSGLYLGHVFDEQRLDAGAEFERQVGDVLRVVHATHGADGELLGAAADDAAAGILDVLRDEVGQFAESHAHVRRAHRAWAERRIAFRSRRSR